VTGQAVVAFVVLKKRAAGVAKPEDDIAALKAHVVNEIGAIADPATFIWSKTFPDALGQDHAPFVARHRRGTRGW